jgi:hypothetical protein
VGTKDDAVRSYKEIAAREGWKPNRENTFKEDNKDIMVFRNPGGDMIWMEIKPGPGGKNYVSLRYQSSAQMIAMNKKLDDQAAAYKAKIKSDLAKPTVTLGLPAGANVVSHAPNQVKISFSTGFAAVAADKWNDGLHETGWTLSSGTRQGGIGTMDLRREGQTLLISFDDSISPRALTVTSTGVGVEVK